MNLARILVQSLNIAYLYLYRLSDSVENIIRYCKKSEFFENRNRNLLCGVGLIDLL